MAKDLKALYPEMKIFGIDVNEQHIQEALSMGLIDESASIEQLDPHLCIALLPGQQTHSFQ